MAKIPFRKLFEFFKVNILQDPYWKISAVEYIFNKITEIHSRPATSLKRRLRQKDRYIRAFRAFSEWSKMNSVFGKVEAVHYIAVTY